MTRTGHKTCARNVFTCVGDIQFNPPPIEVTSSLKDTKCFSLVHLFSKVEWFVPFPPIESEGGGRTSFFPEAQHNGFGLEVIDEVQTLNLYFEEEAAC